MRGDMIEIERDIDMYFGMATYIVRGNKQEETSSGDKRQDVLVLPIDC